MTENELLDIEKRCERARKGPWKSWVEGRDHSSGSSFIEVCGISHADDIELTGATDEDQDFIAQARSDIPRLIAALRNLKAASR